MPFAFSWSSFTSWPAPNYINPVTRGPGWYAADAVFLSLSTITVAVRLYARLWIRRWFGLDDLFICLGWLSAIGVATSVYLGWFKYGWDRHIWDVEPDLLNSSALCFYTTVICWGSSSSFVRLSLLCFYYRLTAHIRIRRYIWILHTVVVTSILFYIAYIFSMVFFCVPPSNFWKHPLQWTVLKCSNIGPIIFSMSVVNTILELVVALLPVPVIFNVNMDRRQRWSIISLLCLGVLVTMLGMVRTWIVWESLIASNDATWWGGPHWTVSEVENNVAIMCACAPALRPVLGRLFSNSPINPPPRDSDAALFSPMPIPTLKPKQYIDYPQAHDATYFDLEGIADDGKGYTFLIMGDDNTEFEDQQPEREGNISLTKVFSKLNQWLRRRRNDVEARYINDTSQQERISEDGRAEMRQQIDEIKEEKFESSRRSEFSQLSQTEASQLPSMDAINSSYLQSPPPAEKKPNDYFSWSKTTDPSRRVSLTNPINSSHSSSRWPQPGYPRQ